MDAKIGSVCFATDQGLGYLAKDFYDNGVIDRVMLKTHSVRTTHAHWYGKDDARILHESNYDWFFKDLTGVIFFETPFDWKLIIECRNRGIKTALMPMHECTNFPLPYHPDIILAPSKLELGIYNSNKEVFIPVPVDEKWKLRKKAKVFIHNAGNGGLGFRNGTPELIKALEYVKSPIKLIIRSQGHDFRVNDNRVEVIRKTVPREVLYATGDVFIFPEKFNGLSLPLQEAFASGMLVMATDRFPMNDWLPKEPLIPISGYRKEKIARTFDSAVINPIDIAMKIDEWYNKDIRKFSWLGRAWAKENSWEELKHKYLCAMR